MSFVLALYWFPEILDTNTADKKFISKKLYILSRSL